MKVEGKPEPQVVEKLRSGIKPRFDQFRLEQTRNPYSSLRLPRLPKRKVERAYPGGSLPGFVDPSSEWYWPEGGQMGKDRLSGLRKRAADLLAFAHPVRSRYLEVVRGASEEDLLRLAEG